MSPEKEGVIRKSGKKEGKMAPSYHSIQTRDIGEGCTAVICEGEGLRHRHRLADPRALDQEIVKFALLSESEERRAVSVACGCGAHEGTRT